MEENLVEVREKIERQCGVSGRESSSVRLIVVTKKHPVDAIFRLKRLGVRDIGESYVDEFKVKYERLKTENFQWHYIGHLARKNTPKVVGNALYIHSVDSLRLARKIDLTAGQMKIIQNVLLQVNMSGEMTKQGFEPQGLVKDDMIEELDRLKNIRIEGLMTMAPYTDDEKVVRDCFSSLRSLSSELKEKTCWPLRELSMGMTNDFLAAIDEGATMLRIGTAVMGERDRIGRKDY